MTMDVEAGYYYYIMIIVSIYSVQKKNIIRIIYVDAQIKPRKFYLNYTSLTKVLVREKKW